MPRIYRLKEVKQSTGHRATSTIYAHIHDGLFPKAVRIGQRSVGWPSHEVDAVIHARIAGHSDEQVRALVAKLHTERANAGMPVPAPAVTPEPKANGLQLVEG